MNLPNTLTLGRIILIPVFVALFYLKPESWYYWAALVIFIAAVTDWLDGFIARKYHLITKLGKFIDPIADKLLVSSALIVLVQWSKIGSIVCIILIGREFIISGFRMIAASQGVVIAAGMSGKIKTVFQFIGIIAIFLQNPFFSDYNIPFGEIMLYISVVLSIWSCIEYFVKNRNLLTEGK